MAGITEYIKEGVGDRWGRNVGCGGQNRAGVVGVEGKGEYSQGRKGR